MGLSYLTCGHEATRPEVGEVQWLAACGPAGRRRPRRKRETGLLAETLPSHRTSFPPVASNSLVRLNLRRPHREDGGRQAGRQAGGEGEREEGLLSAARVM